jgi:hypothetical protein
LDLPRSDFGFVDEGSCASLTAISVSSLAPDGLYDKLLEDCSKPSPMELLLVAPTSKSGR